MPRVASLFREGWFVAGGHAQTLWGPVVRRGVRVVTRRERLELPDGDFVDLEWVDGAEGRPIVVVLHGLQGSARSSYVRGMMRALGRAGMRAVLMHFRGCSGEPNRLPRGYHSGETGDLAYLVRTLGERHPGVPVAAIGYSLGANVLLKWLGETGRENPLAAAVGVSPPFELGLCADKIGRGFSRVYESHLLRSLQRAVRGKLGETPTVRRTSPSGVGQERSLREFDERVTAPMHGFAGAEDYYTRSSCRQYLSRIAVPTLILHARDDPFTPACAIPDERELSPVVELEVSEGGGHVGFVGGIWPWAPAYWLEERVPRFLRAALGG